MEHYRNEKKISYMDIKDAQGAELNLFEFIERQGKREILEQLFEAMEYGKAYRVLLEKSTENNGFSTTLSFDLRFEKLEG